MDTNMIAKVTQTATDACADYLRKAILDGQYSEGKPIVIDRLASQIGVSQTPIREAIRRLEAEGFLTFIPKRGATVRPIDPNEFEELVEIRKALEPIVLHKAISNTTNVTKINGHTEFKFWVKQTDPSSILDAQWNFYSAIYSPAGQARILDLIATNWKHIHRYHRVAWVMSDKIRNKDIRLMRELFQQYKKKDLDGANKALINVIDWGKSIVDQTLRSK